MKSIVNTVFLSLSILIIPYSYALAEINSDIKMLQQEWAKIKYTLDKKEHESNLERLSDKASNIRMQQPNNANAYLWEGIILSTYAGSIGTLRALEIVTRSKDALELSLSIDPLASNGAANSYLGILYLHVPEWPIAFGDKDLAKQYIEKAIALTPDDIDANFFYGEFLKKQKKYNAAKLAYKKVIDAPARVGRELADKGRRDEARLRLVELTEKDN